MGLTIVGIYPWHEIPEHFQKWLKDDSRIIVEMDRMTVSQYPNLQEYYDRMGPKDVAIVCQEADSHLIPRLETLTKESEDWWNFWEEAQCFGSTSLSGWQSWSDTFKD